MKKFILVIFLVTGFWLLATRAFASETIRVRIFDDLQSFSLSANSYYKLVDSTNNQTLASGKNLRTIVWARIDGISINGTNYQVKRITLEANDPEAIVINERKFRGNMQFIRKDNGKIMVINLIELEDYIKGILYHEVSHYWPDDALKAQAIVCRTYALYQVNMSLDKDFDLSNDVYSQVYGGLTSERFRTSKAVDDSKGEVLVYKKNIFPTYFHATCSGHTEDAKLLWGIDIPPLKGVACSYCKESPHYSWAVKIPLKKLREALLKSVKKDCANITGIAILGKDPSDRITDLKIITDKDSFVIPAKDFRMIVGPNQIMSTNFTLEIKNDKVIFNGLGWGHGVGLCQWGAYFMAKQGKNYKQILKYYYPGSEITKYKD